MEPPEQLKQKVLTEKRLINRLRLATTRLEDAQQEHIWAIAAAKSEGLSIRKIAAATGLSSSRVHQLLHTNGALQIPKWLNSLTDPESNTDEQPPDKEIQSLKKFQQRLAEESEVMRWCIGWLKQLASGERVVINLRAESDSRTAFVDVDHKWVMRVLNRIAADLDQLSRRELARIAFGHPSIWSFCFKTAFKYCFQADASFRVSRSQTFSQRANNCKFCS